MMAISILCKLLSWAIALKLGDSGSPKRPWILGLMVGGVFAFFDVASEHRDETAAIVLTVFDLVSALTVLHIYYRTQNIVGAIALAAVGTGLLFFGGFYVLSMISD